MRQNHDERVKTIKGNTGILGIQTSEIKNYKLLFSRFAQSLKSFRIQIGYSLLDINVSACVRSAFFFLCAILDKYTYF